MIHVHSMLLVSHTHISITTIYLQSSQSTFNLHTINLQFNQSTHISEFDRLLEKHATQTGLPVMVDFFSESCGPCRMMAPIFHKIAQEYTDRAVFVKVNTQVIHDLSARYQIHSLPNFLMFLNGKKVQQAVGGIGEAPLREEARKLVLLAEQDNVVFPFETLTDYYQQADVTKTPKEIATIYEKCVQATPLTKACVGQTARTLARKLQT